MKTRLLILMILMLLMPTSKITAQTEEIDIFSENYLSNEEPFVNRTWTNRMLYELSEAFNWELSEQTLETLGTSANTTYYYPLEQGSEVNQYEIYLFSGDIGERQFVELKITPMVVGTLNEDDRQIELFETAIRLLQPEVASHEVLEAYETYLYNHEAVIKINDVNVYIQGYADEVIYASRELTQEINEGIYPNLAGAVLEEQADEVKFDEHEVHFATTKQSSRPSESFEPFLPGNFFERSEQNAVNATYLEAFQYLNWIIYDVYSNLTSYGERMAFEGKVIEVYPRESTQVVVIEAGTFEVADTMDTKNYTIYLLTDEIELKEGDNVSGYGQFIGIETTDAYTPSIVADELIVEGQSYQIRTAGESE